jgi:NDP-sugar pyrophosphorylase family protein
MRNDIRKAIILAGGKGSRLHPVTLEIPKPLITVRKRPILSYALANFVKYGVNEAKIIIRPSDQEDYARWQREYGSEFRDMKIEFVHEPEPMGTFGYIFYHLREWIGGDDIFVTNADEVKYIDLKKMAEAHRAHPVSVTVAVMHMNNPEEYGAVLVRENKITEFLEKKQGLPPGLVSSGMYVLSAAAFDHIEASIPKDQKFLMFEKDMFPVLAKQEKLGAYVSDGRFFDCGTFDRWELAIREA